MKAKKKHLLPRKAKLEPRPVMTLHPVFHLHVTQPAMTFVIRLPNFLQLTVAAVFCSTISLIILAAWLG